MKYSLVAQEIRLRRQHLRLEIQDEIGDLCESCNFSTWVDINEVFVLRNDVPVKYQVQIFVRGNCAGLCRPCHDKFHGKAPKEEIEAFKERFAARLRKLGHEPLSPDFSPRRQLGL